MSDLTPEELEQVLGEPVVRGEDGETVVVRFNDDGTTDNFVLPADPTDEDIEIAAALVDRSLSQGASVPEPPSLPQEPEDEETPPDEATPTFIVRLNHYGPGAHSILLADGTPL